MKEQFCSEIKNVFNKHNINLTEKQIEDFYRYYSLLVEWNQKFNLTAITEQSEVIVKHFLDSVICYSLLPENAKIIDIGAGAGFPSFPLKILRPDLKITLIDSVNKKVTFQQEVIKQLNFTNAEAIHTRAEDLAKNIKYRETFDGCVSRAVAQLNTLVEYSLPFIKIGGKMFAYKSNEIEEELNNSTKAISILGGKVKENITFNVDNVDRKIIIINKVSNTPNKYPRPGNKPRLMPL